MWFNQPAFDAFFFGKFYNLNRFEILHWSWLMTLWIPSMNFCLSAQHSFLRRFLRRFCIVLSLNRTHFWCFFFDICYRFECDLFSVYLWMSSQYYYRGFGNRLLIICWSSSLVSLFTFGVGGNPVGKITQKAVCRSVFLVPN